MRIWHVGTINDDLQCSRVSLYAALRIGTVLVFNCCKNWLPSEYWVCVMLPPTRDVSARYVYFDCRKFGVKPSAYTKTLRRDMALTLVHNFDDAEAIWRHALKIGAPHKTVGEEAAA